MRTSLMAAAAACALLSLAAPAAGQNLPNITTPQQAFGHAIGEDYFLANYTQAEAYLKTLAKESDRTKLVEIGKSGFGRSQYMMIVSSPENIRNLEKYRSIAERLAQAKDLTDDQARALAKEGKAVIWIDGGMHASESIHAQALLQGIYSMVSRTDPEAMRFLDDVIILFGEANPDGQEQIANWYMRNPDPKAREFESLPYLYNRYIGHDNNRDYFRIAQVETTNLTRVFYRQWHPQIIYNHHQPGPPGMVVFIPPFRDPFNYNYDPLIMTALEETGTAIHSRLITEGKPGSAMRSAANYSTWYNGNERTSSYFHNTVGILTEIIGGPTPEELPLIAGAQLPRSDEPMPVPPQLWHMSQSIDYELSMNNAVLDYASRNRDRLLFNIYRMGKNSIERGSRDNWTVSASRIDALRKAGGDDGTITRRGGGHPVLGKELDPSLYKTVLQDPARRDARGYVISADQPDLPSAVEFVNALIRAGVEVQRATAPFTVAGKSYPAGSFVVMTAQAYRPHIVDMFEPQDHPNDFEYPGGPPQQPHDITGYTLAFQNGLRFDRVLDGFSGPFQTLPDEIAPPSGRIDGAGQAGWLISHAPNNAFTLTNRLMKAGAKVSWLKTPVTIDGATLAPGTLWVPATPTSRRVVEAAVKTLGLNAHALDKAPAGEALALKAPRIGLVDLYGGLMPTGWTRFIFDQFEFPYTVVHPQELDAGKLKAKYDVLIFTDGAYRPPQGVVRSSQTERQGFDPQSIPKEYRAWLGSVTEKTAAQVDAFAKAGGSVVTIGSSNYLAAPLKLPVEDGMIDPKTGKSMLRTTFYSPGALLTATVDNRQPLAYGMPTSVSVFYDNSPIFRPAVGAGVSKVAWFQGDKVLKSGWAFGQEHLNGMNAILDVSVGRGHVFLMGPEVTQRAQPAGTYKFLFNAIYYGPAAAGG
ncbi:peptidase [Phenylobacterium hankyongense]|uniref:Peptidase n=1 Tax=Phenylobacterium hankyongense TaxID=1813876 RepID=A0A328B061_9CAUL|nr:M14 metallopeptidase family protein [Phenylobacterium hankyongense]RAK60289.1 peptidase [Phenylobacterium hankyongense]